MRSRYNFTSTRVHAQHAHCLRHRSFSSAYIHVWARRPNRRRCGCTWTTRRHKVHAVVGSARPGAHRSGAVMATQESAIVGAAQYLAKAEMTDSEADLRECLSKKASTYSDTLPSCFWSRPLTTDMRGAGSMPSESASKSSPSKKAWLVHAVMPSSVPIRVPSFSKTSRNSSRSSAGVFSGSSMLLSTIREYTDPSPILSFPNGSAPTHISYTATPTAHQSTAYE
mmetsp:Transcript_30260/g.51709  ORF Transcript_30260/g.51709 Transcript_30260/m.51709 type:complete len:225 (+) Transcript_30260:261-935(+)